MMRSPGFKVFMPSVLGAFIGSLVGLQLTPMSWWFGMLVGGAVGHVGYDAKSAVLAVPVAWRQTHYCLAGLRREFAAAMHALGRVVGILFCLASTMIALGLSWSIPCSLATHLLADHGPSWHCFSTWFMSGQDSIWSHLLATLLWNLLLGIGALIGSTLFAVIILKVRADDEEWLRGAFRFGNPTAWLAYWIPRALLLAGRSVGISCWQFFKLVHSERRLLCGLDAAVGAAAGIGFHNPILGAMVGGAVGIAHYEIVSKRWLKLVGAR